MFNFFNLFKKISEGSPQETAKKILGSNIGFIDVRTEEEYALGHAKGTKNIPLGELENHIQELTKFDSIYIICQSGSRSMNAVNILHFLGVKAVNVSGGTRAWISAGLPME